MTILELMTSPSPGWWGRYGRASEPWSIADDFVLGVTQPSPSNTGCRWALEDMTTVGTGALTSLTTPGATYQGVIFNGGVRIQASGITLRDCIITFPDGITADRHGIYCWYGATDVTIEHCTIICPESARNYFIGAGIHGVGFTASRNRIEGMTDGIIAAGTGSTGYVNIYGNYIANLPYYDFDGYPSRSGSHSDGSHPDGIQVQGNLTDVEVIGNTVGTARTSCVIFTNGSGTYESVRVEDNWFPVSDPLFGSFVNFGIFPGGGTIPLSIKRNKFPPMSETPKARMYIPPALLATADLHSNGPDRNEFFDGSSPVPVWRGSGVTPANLYEYNEVV